MKLADQERALARAAEPALAALQEDEDRAPKWLRPLFAACRGLLFTPDLDLDQIRKAAGFPDAEVWNALREEVGQPAWSYLREARLETAAHLLLDTDLSIAAVGRLVGYSSIPSFRRRLRDFLGILPSKYRGRARRRRQQFGPGPDGSQTTGYWERMLAGELSDDEAQALDAYLERLAPSSTKTSGEEGDPWTRLLRSFAESIFETIDPGQDPTESQAPPLPLAIQGYLVRDAVTFPDETLFEVLSEHSLRATPDRGVELAHLGLGSLLANGMYESDPECAALAWARLAQARQRAGDLAGAYEDLTRSESEAARARELRPAWAAERNRIVASFRRQQKGPG